MKIFEIIPQLNSGGAERFVVDLCNQLSKEHSVTLITFHQVKEFHQYHDELDQNVNYICLNKKLGPDISLFWKLYRLIKTNNPDIVHTHLSAIIYTSFSSIVKRDVKYIHTIHNDAAIEAEYGPSKFIRQFVFKYQLIHPVTISEISQTSFNEFYHQESTLIYNGCSEYKPYSTDTLSEITEEINNLKYDKNSFVILNVARIQPQKNQVVLAKAIDNLNKHNVKVELFNIGKQSSQQMVEAINNMHSPYIHLIGEKPNPRDYMYIADAFCLSSLFEGMPITLIECFSVGAFPICTPVGGILNMIRDNFNGILCKGTSQQEIEMAITRFVNMSQDKKNEVQQNSKSTFSRFNIKSSADNYIELMTKLANKF